MGAVKFLKNDCLLVHGTKAWPFKLKCFGVKEILFCSYKPIQLSDFRRYARQVVFGWSSSAFLFYSYDREEGWVGSRVAKSQSWMAKSSYIRDKSFKQKYRENICVLKCLCFIFQYYDCWYWKNFVKPG